ncbi:MAG: ribonuclease HIII [Verrucomicrobia bacterium]|nr:ribonuclease HIII [Verrucomicrobiota bacterium]
MTFEGLYIGSDEAGKGDFFGPLVVAAIAVNDETVDILKTIGVKDSKKLSDTKIDLLASVIRQKIPYDQIVLFPKTYNELYLKFKNLNHLLAWSHAAVIKTLMEKTGARQVLVDQFSQEPLVEHYLKKKGLDFDIKMFPKAESDIAVAGASILARNAFLEGLHALGESIGTSLKKGASAPVQAQAKEILEVHGKELFPSIAKVHFKTYKDLISG